MLPQPHPAPKRELRGVASPYATMKPSKSMPSLLPSDQLKPESLHDKCMGAFENCDTNGSGTISKRELITVLRRLGLKDTKNALALFDGFDVDGNAELYVGQHTLRNPLARCVFPHQKKRKTHTHLHAAFPLCNLNNNPLPALSSQNAQS